MADKEPADQSKPGQKAAQMLHDAGIQTVQQLSDIGAVEVYVEPASFDVAG